MPRTTVGPPPGWDRVFEPLLPSGSEGRTPSMRRPMVSPDRLPVGGVSSSLSFPAIVGLPLWPVLSFACARGWSMLLVSRWSGSPDLWPCRLHCPEGLPVSCRISPANLLQWGGVRVGQTSRGSPSSRIGGANTAHEKADGLTRSTACRRSFQFFELSCHCQSAFVASFEFRLCTR